MYNNDLIKELGTNFIEYAVAVNTDRAIPDATSGLKPVAKRIIYGAYNNGHSSKKPLVKCANIVGEVMGQLHPHGDSSIYGALVRLVQPWVMRYPLMDWHGNRGNIAGDGPAAYRYTESRLSKFTEEGLLFGIKKNNVDFIPNYDETGLEPVTLPAIFPNLLCNPNTGIGVAMACNWGCHNLGEVAQAIYDYLDGKEPMLPGPDFPTGGIVINKNDFPTIMKTGRGSVKIRGKYEIDGNNIIFTEIPYGTTTEAILEDIAKACENKDINGIKEIRDESNKKGLRLVIECAKDANISLVIKGLFRKTNLQSSFSYNQVALINKTPTELNLKDCIKIYVKHNLDCILRETEFDIEKLNEKKHIVDGLLRALEDIDNIIALIKKSQSASTAQVELQAKYNFSEKQSKAIVEMKLGRLAGLEKIELQQEQANLIEELEKLNTLISSEKNLQQELILRLKTFVDKYGDKRRTELAQIVEEKEEKEIVYVEPEKCVVVLTESGLVKRIPATSFRVQKRNGKGVKTQDDITSMIIRTNTIDSLMIFTNKGMMYRLLVDNIPVGTNTTKGTPIKALVQMEPNETPAVIYSVYRDTDAKYVLFTTKQGMVKKTSLDEYIGTKKKNGLNAIKLKEGDSIASVNLVKEEDIILITKQGYAIHFDSKEIGASGRITIGIKGIALKDDDYIVSTLVIRQPTDDVAIFIDEGLGKRIKLSEIPKQKRGGKGLICSKEPVAGAIMVEDKDQILVCGDRSSICFAAGDMPVVGRTAAGNMVIKNSNITSVSKV